MEKCYFCGFESTHVNSGGVLFYALLGEKQVPFCWTRVCPQNAVNRVHQIGDYLYINDDTEYHHDTEYPERVIPINHDNFLAACKRAFELMEGPYPFAFPLELVIQSNPTSPFGGWRRSVYWFRDGRIVSSEYIELIGDDS